MPPDFSKIRVAMINPYQQAWLFLYNRLDFVEEETQWILLKHAAWTLPEIPAIPAPGPGFSMADDGIDQTGGVTSGDWFIASVATDSQELFSGGSGETSGTDLPSIATFFNLESFDEFGQGQAMPLSTAEDFPNPDCVSWFPPNAPPHSYDSWTETLPMGSDDAFSATPLGDGVPNLLKFALGIDGSETGRQCVPRPVWKEHDNDVYLALAFARLVGLENKVRHVLETSTDLVNWTQLCDPVVLTESTSVQDVEAVWILDDVPASAFDRRFLRLRLLHEEAHAQDEPWFAWLLANELVGENAGLTMVDAGYSGYVGSSWCFRSGIEHGLVQYDEQEEIVWSMDSGIILTTGLARDWNKPGNSNTAFFHSFHDHDLETWMEVEGLAMWSGFSSLDAAALEIDFVPQHANIELAFLFGSEEYYRPSGSKNDAMAIFLGKLDQNGDVIPATWQNIGILPETETTSSAVAVFNIGYVRGSDPPFHNNLVDSLGQPMFINNSHRVADHLPNIPATVPPHGVTYSGFTRRFIASATVEPDADYRLKIVIADTSDGLHDSGLFIQTASFRSY